MTAMPQLVSVFNAVGGGAAALVGDPRLHPAVGAGARAPSATTVTTLLDVIIGAVTFSGSIIAAGKLQGVITSAAGHLPRRPRASTCCWPWSALGTGGYLIASHQPGSA